MKSYFNFEQYTPPRLTESVLQKRAQKQNFRCYALLFSIAFLLWNLCFCLFSLLFMHRSFALGFILLSLWCLSLIGSGVISVIFLYSYQQRKE